MYREILLILRANLIKKIFKFICFIDDLSNIVSHLISQCLSLDSQRAVELVYFPEIVGLRVPETDRS